MREILLSARGVQKHFSGAVVLRGVDLDLYDGDFTVIMGPSGAGKSTLLYALSGMDQVDEGTITYKGDPLNHLSEPRMAALRAREFGFVFQQTHLVSNLTLLENVLVAGFLDKSRTEAKTRQRAAELLAQMQVEEAGQRLPGQVSGGEAQRAAMARAVINHPGLLFADEPTGALNRKNSTEVLDLLTNLNRSGQSILLVTHDLRAALRGNRILYLEDGGILDELTLPPYGEERNNMVRREEQLNAWLSRLAW